jgi:hypothetical protein
MLRAKKKLTESFSNLSIVMNYTRDIEENSNSAASVLVNTGQTFTSHHLNSRVMEKIRVFQEKLCNLRVIRASQVQIIYVCPLNSHFFHINTAKTDLVLPLDACSCPIGLCVYVWKSKCCKIELQGIVLSVRAVYLGWSVFYSRPRNLPAAHTEAFRAYSSDKFSSGLNSPRPLLST